MSGFEALKSRNHDKLIRPVYHGCISLIHKVQNKVSSNSKCIKFSKAKVLLLERVLLSSLKVVCNKYLPCLDAFFVYLGFLCPFFWMPSSMAHFRRMCSFSNIKPRNKTRTYSYVKYLIRVMKKAHKNRVTCVLKYNIWHICNTNSHRCIVCRNEVCNFGSWSHLLLSHIQDSLQYLWSN